MPQVQIQVPKSVMSLPKEDRDAILGVLAKAVRLPAVMPVYHESSGDEHDMWHSDPDSLLGQVEDELYNLLNEWNIQMMADVIAALDLPTEGVDMMKALEFDLLKGKNTGKNRMSELIEASKAKREKFLKYMQDMNPFSKQQLKKLDNLLKQKLPDYAKIAEDFMVRAGFIGKIRNQAEKEAFETMGALVDRYPSTIKAAEKEGVVLTLRKEKRLTENAAEGRKVMILPLTPLESKAVQHAAQHAAEKMTEISQRHMAGVRQTIIRAQRERQTPQKLAQELFDQYGEQNRDWRRVAITELAFSANDAYIAGCEEGETVVGMGADNACKYCKQYVIGKQFTVTHQLPKNTYSHEMNMVWAGKSNYRRKVSEYIPAIPMHPNCRCRWHKISRFYKVPEGGGRPVLKETWELIQEERLRRGMGLDPSLPIPYNMR